LDYWEEHEKDHGRHSSWYVRFIHVHKHTIKKGKESHSDRLYISDRYTIDAQYYHEGIRGHWTIENSLHWVKDVIHKEDKNAIRTANGPVNSSVYSSIAINIHRIHGCHSITESQIKFGTNVNELFKLLRT